MNIPGPDVIFEEDKVADGVLPDDVVGEGCDVADEETCVELAERSVADAVEAVAQPAQCSGRTQRIQQR
jgi:hypothetical protein